MPITLSIQALIDAQTTALNTTINAARDNVKADNVTQITAQNTALTAAVNAARDAVNANVDTDIAALATVVTAARDAVNANTDTKTASVTTAVNSKGTIKASLRGTGQLQGTYNNTITISAIDPNKALVLVDLSNGTGSVMARIASSTTIIVSGQPDATYSWQVVEFF